MSKSPREELALKLQDHEYLQFYGAELAKTEVAVKIARARMLSNLTQKELSEKLNISQPYIAKLEQGEANPTIGTIGRVLAVMGYRMLIEFEVFDNNYNTKKEKTSTNSTRDYKPTTTCGLSGYEISQNIPAASADDTLNIWESCYACV